jgi:hypothetical protein
MMDLLAFEVVAVVVSVVEQKVVIPVLVVELRSGTFAVVEVAAD